MRGRDTYDDDLAEFVSARTQDLHHDAFLLTASQFRAEHLVVAVLAELRRRRVDLSRASSTAHLRMTQVAARSAAPTELEDVQLPERFRPLARLSPRQRAVLLLHVVGGYDERAISRTLHLSGRDAAATLRTIPYDELPGGGTDSNQLRSFLEDFGDLGTAPSPTVTIADVHSVRSVPRRRWWSYAAAVVVVALTATTLVVTQRWHDDWLHTPDGLNHAHRTHFPTYTHGYELVTIRDVAPGIAKNVTAGAVALPCDVVGPDVRLSVLSKLTDGYTQESCLSSESGPRLVETGGKASATVLGGHRPTYPLAIYKKIPLSEYPVATKDFDVQRDRTLADVRKEAAGGKQPPGAAGRAVLTLRGTAAHHNGTFTGRLQLPAITDELAPPLHAVGLLSPTTTGRFRVRVDGVPPTTDCGEPGPLTDYRVLYTKQCSLVDRRVPQVRYLLDASAFRGPVQVEVTVQNAHGPWTLQFVTDTYDHLGTSAD